MQAQRFSRQRESILEYLASTKEHPCADTVFREVRKNNPSISLGTVYRNLNLLADHGVILRLTCGDGQERFDGNPTPHYHFICRSCTRVLDLDLSYQKEFDQLAAEQFCGKIEGHTGLFFGICPVCCKQESTKTENQSKKF